MNFEAARQSVDPTLLADLLPLMEIANRAPGASFEINDYGHTVAVIAFAGSAAPRGIFLRQVFRPDRDGATGFKMATADLVEAWVKRMVAVQEAACSST